MKTINLILFVLLFVFPNRQEPKPLFEGIYTETGYGVTDKQQPLNSGTTFSYYVKIYEDKLVLTTAQYGSISTVDISYQYHGNDADGNRIYTNGESESYCVDNNYDSVTFRERRSMNLFTFNCNYYDYIFKSSLSEPFVRILLGDFRNARQRV